MITSLLIAVLRALDLCVTEHVRAESPSLRLLTPAPVWLAGVFETVPPEVGQVLGSPIPFVAHFLPQAEETWREGEGAAASSGPFAITVEGEEMVLLATATPYHDRRLLILHPLTVDADLLSTLRRAREKVLELERLGRLIDAMHVPLWSIERDSKTLAASSLSPDHHAVAERLNKASAEVQALLATLPSPRSRPRRQARPK